MEEKMKTRANLTFILLLCSMFTIAWSAEHQFTIKYMSAENIYIDGGQLDGLAVGDTLVVMRKNTKIAALLINYTADHSAACTLLYQRVQINPGDMARPATLRKTGTSGTDEGKTTLPVRQTRQPAPQKSVTSGVRVGGNVSMQWYHVSDLSNGKYNFDQPGMRLNLKMHNLFSKNINFRLKTRSRYNMREREFSSTIPKDAWRNRIYTASLSYDDPKAALNFRFGRIISNAFSGIGYIDGAMVQHNVTERVHYGMFAGTQPQWQYADFQTSIQKYGAFVNYVQGEYGGKRFESTLAAAGEYHGGDISREFLYFQNSYTNARFNFFQSAELDVNRNWRRDRSGESLSLTNIYLNMSYRITSGITTGLSFDDRKNYYTWEIRSVADSLFDDAMRYGARWNLNWRLPGNYRLFMNAGLRARETDTENTYSYALGLNKSSMTSLRLYMNIYASGFHNYFSDGYHASVRFGKHFRGGHDLNLGYGNYSYMISTVNTTHSNHWLRANGNLLLGRHLYMGENYEYIWGSDSPGHRIYTELGYRF